MVTVQLELVWSFGEIEGLTTELVSAVIWCHCDVGKILFLQYEMSCGNSKIKSWQK